MQLLHGLLALLLQGRIHLLLVGVDTQESHSASNGRNGALSGAIAQLRGGRIVELGLGVVHLAFCGNLHSTGSVRVVALEHLPVPVDKTVRTSSLVQRVAWLVRKLLRRDTAVHESLLLRGLQESQLLLTLEGLEHGEAVVLGAAIVVLQALRAFSLERVQVSLGPTLGEVWIADDHLRNTDLVQPVLRGNPRRALVDCLGHWLFLL